MLSGAVIIYCIHSQSQELCLSACVYVQAEVRENMTMTPTSLVA